MAKHIVTCRICGNKFDMNAIQAVKIGNLRYAHLSCSPDKGEIMPLEEKTEEEQELEKLKEYIKNLLGDSYNHVLVSKQIKKYVKENNYSYSGILKSLKYFYEVQGNTTEKAMGGIGIVPYCYEQAKTYYFNMWLAQQKNISKNLDNYFIKEVTFEILPPKREIKQKRLFSVDNDIIGGTNEEE